MLFLLMLCITGLPLIFAHEIHDWIDPHPPIRADVADTSSPSLESLVQRAMAARPTGHVVPYLYFEDDEPHVVGVATAATMRPPPSGDWEGLHFQVFDQRDGLLLGSRGVKKNFMYVMMRLHVDLFANLPGTLFLGVMGLLLVVAVISGVVVYAPFMRKLDFAAARIKRGPRVLWLDLHNLLGIVTVAWVLVVGITGVINTLARPLDSIWEATELADMLKPYENATPLIQRVPVDVVIDTARKAAPDMKLQWINFPGAVVTSPHHYTAFMAGNTPLTSRLRTPALIDAGTGKLTDMRAMPWYIKTLNLSQPLHFGDYGGLPLKTIWALLTLITIVVLGSGIYLWLRGPAGVRQAKIRHLVNARGRAA